MDPDTYWNNRLPWSKKAYLQGFDLEAETHREDINIF